MATKPKNTARKPRRAKPVENPAKLRALINLIEEYGASPLTGLLHRLETKEGLKSDLLKTGETQVAMAGLSAKARGDMRLALTNWCQAARRALLKAG